MIAPDPSFPYPRVQHVAVIDLTGDFWNFREVDRSLFEQGRYIPDGAHIRVRLGESVLATAGIGLDRQIACRFAHAASIDIEVPGGVRNGLFIAQGVDRNVRQIRADHAELTASLAEPKTG